MSYDAIKGSDIKAVAQAIEKLANRPQPYIPPNVPDATLSPAIENGLLTLAEAIKYAVDAYVELHSPPKIPHPNQPDGTLHEVPWRTARVGDWIIPTGIGLGATNKVWANKLVQVTRANDTIFWDDGHGTEVGGCYNNADRFKLYEE